KKQHGTVGYVFDGDTLRLRGGQESRLRLWGVDAPEKDEAGFQEAKIALESIALNRKITFIEIDQDRYGRTVARVFLSDGREVNRMMIESGTAKEYRRFSKGFYSWDTD
ncbi:MULTISPECIES: thermonuclease family protein, partial [unclassified Phaeobacter]|uniref:thermonuclease family protein n=1 Tax=unclassified Phaeobacter TaxID=2621772 RepID=UPI003A88CF4C